MNKDNNVETNFESEVEALAGPELYENVSKSVPKLYENISKSVPELKPELNPVPETETEPNKFSLDNPNNFPDKGLHSYLVVLGAFLNFIPTLGLFNASAALQNYISYDILPHEPTSSIGWIFSVFSFVSFAANLFTSPMYNYVGAKKLGIIGTVFFSVGLFCFSCCKELYQFVLAYLCCGIGVSFSFATSLNTITQWFYVRRATAIGVSYVGGALGGIIVPIVLDSLYDKLGFGWSVRILAFIFLFLLLVSLLLLKDRRQELNIVPGKGFHPNSLFAFSLFKDKVFFSFVLACIGNSTPFGLASNYIVSYAVAQGIGSFQASYLPVALNCTSIIGRVGGGIMSDKFGRFNFFLGINILACFAYFVLWLPPPIGHTTGGIYVFACIFGITSGSYFQASPSCLGQLGKTRDFGKSYGTLSFIVSIINFISLPIGGAIVGNHDNSSGYDNLVIFVAIVAFVGMVSIILCRIWYAGINLLRV